MSFSISFPHVLGASYSQRIPWTVQVPFIVDRKFPRLEDTHLATHNLNIHIGKSHILKDVNVEIPQNKITCIIGPSGCGKTTLLRTFNRLVDSIEGVKIDGEVNLGKQDVVAAGPSQMTELRRNIGLVPQRPCPLPMSIYDNIAYGRPGAKKEEVLKAAKLANADEFIKKLPDGYETMVGERGVKLSGGQRQRIAIARAILKDAPILVLDEATSALDSESEALIQEALNNLMKGRTSIVVAHRLSTIAGLDKIVVLNDGKIVEQGTHAELLARGGEYQKLWSRQSGAFLDED